MTSLKPYLIRAIYEWIVDNSLTPHLLVSTDNTDTIVPEAFIEDEKIVLNIRPEAVQGLSMGNEFIEFNARFGGKPMHITVPVPAVLAIYGKENGKGMVFDLENENDTDPTLPPKDNAPIKPPQLRIVK